MLRAGNPEASMDGMKRSHHHSLPPLLGASLFLTLGCIEVNKTSDDGAALTDDSVAACAAAKTEDGCAAVVTPVTDRGEGCRWGEIKRAEFEGDACTLVAIGGECIFATYDEGGPGCMGFFRSNEDGGMDLVQVGCGDPADDAWTLCFGQELSSSAHAACECLNSAP